MSNEDKPVSISDKVEILSTEDDKIKAIGEILSSDTSRNILTVLFNQSLSANEISQKTEISLPLVIYHLKKMQESGVVKITNVGKNTKSHDMKFYTVDKFAIVILPTQMSKPAKTSKSLINSFTRIHRLATLGAASIAVWFSSQVFQESIIEQQVVDHMALPTDEEATMIFKSESVPETMIERSTAQAAPVSGEPSFDILWSIVAVLSILVAGLAIELVIKVRKERQLTT